MEGVYVNYDNTNEGNKSKTNFITLSLVTVIHVLLKSELLHIHFLQFLAFLWVKTICCSF